MTFAMTSKVEAQSLSSLTALASNPPLDPQNPTPLDVPSLVLYIVRVPGSRDIFLTPLKPREKVVSAEDVQSSLYYAHFNSAEDDRLLRPSSANKIASQLARITETRVARKPLLPARSPATPPYPVDNRAPGSKRPASPRQAVQISTKPVFADVTNSQNLPAKPDLPTLPRRPLPTPPADEDLPPLPHRPPLHQENERLLRDSEQKVELNPYFSVYEPVKAAVQEDERPAKRDEPGTLTLIRRDPATSDQWNVASIHDPPVEEVSSTALLTPSHAKRTKKGGAPVYLDITNPGYAQYIKDPSDRPESRVSTSSTSSDSNDGLGPPPEGTLRRRIWMPGSRFAEHGYGHRKIPSESSVGSLEKMRRSMRYSQDNAASLAPAVDSRSTSYAFTSPWDGVCEFSTSAGGRSLKCKHTLPKSGMTATVSELRFNLPSSSTPTPMSDKRSSNFLRRQSNLTDHDGNSPEPMDLSLGQERAGGGLGGKQAKLGKLIVEPEGMKMLDLIVAANVGLWWRAYDRF